MTDLTLMTFASDPATVLPSLALLSHRVRVLPMDAASLVKMPENTILFLDARDDLATAKTLCRLIHASGLSTPIVLVLTEGGFTVVNSQWGIADVVVASASPAEVEGRLRLVSERGNSPVNAVSGSGESGVQNEDGMIHSGDLVVDTNRFQVVKKPLKPECIRNIGFAYRPSPYLHPSVAIFRDCLCME